MSKIVSDDISSTCFLSFDREFTLLTTLYSYVSSVYAVLCYVTSVGGSGLEDLHNAAMLLGSQELARGNETEEDYKNSPHGTSSPEWQPTRRSRRQMGYSAPKQRGGE